MSEATPHLLTSVGELRKFMAAEHAAGRRVGLVPTMGALHEGHLSLVRAAQQECDTTLATLFVNPSQFGPEEDFSKYPRSFEADREKLAACNTTALFAPENQEVYPAGYSTYIEPPAVAHRLEGELRPDHFRGVCTIVLKLFLMSGADVAFFGQKDYQQAQVIRQMATDLNVPIEIRICPIVRESDGLAMSSRNAYLSAEQRKQAVGLYQALGAANDWFTSGHEDAQQAVDLARERLSQHNIEQIDYVAAVHATTLAPVSKLTANTVLLLAAHVGSTRLIDNWRLGID